MRPPRKRGQTEKKRSPWAETFQHLFARFMNLYKMV